MAEADEVKPDERALLCGWRSFRPKFLQRLNTPKWNDCHRSDSRWSHFTREEIQTEQHSDRHDNSS
ncbi:hypothetical protein OS493_017045 [Desmophyllum pertusum]|uniref:Uncharacterized protein n=1 Tax=Desmophyllum pertusum TaxID=174260 RepID=A0A9X0CEW7_9CNID|nr:hypothetical protein OS493_017045 [Desmophyllum pertusum]